MVVLTSYLIRNCLLIKTHDQPRWRNVSWKFLAGCVHSESSCRVVGLAADPTLLACDVVHIRWAVTLSAGQCREVREALLALLRSCFLPPLVPTGISVIDQANCQSFALLVGLWPRPRDIGVATGEGIIENDVAA